MLDKSGLVDDLYKLMDYPFQPAFNMPMLGLIR